MTIKFCGLTVENINTTLGWNEKQSQMSLSLILDSGDFNLIPPVGYPVYFTYGAMEFNGLLQRAEEDIGTGGRRINVQVVDPREILRCCSLIIGGYSGSTFTLPNLVNCYAYQENRRGFGAANVTSSGMAWYLIRESINQIVNIPSETSFGGPLNYKGNRYSVDLSEVPTMPAFYRIGATSINLFDAISQVCRDSNNDFYITLHGYRIKINTVPKGRMIPQNTLQNYIRNLTLNSGSVESGRFGVEDVSGENTSVMLVGDGKEDLYETTDIKSFWGYDKNNQPIFGVSGYKLWVPTLGIGASAGYDFRNGTDKLPKDANRAYPRSFLANYDIRTPNNNPAVFNNFEASNFTYEAILENIEMANLNALPVQDIVLAEVYQCSTLEMRYALSDLGDWEDFIIKMRPDVYEKIYGFKPVPPEQINNLPNNAEVVVDDPNKILSDLASIQKDVNDEKNNRLYAFVRAYADEYYGKKFACSLPSIASSMNLETLQMVNAADIVQSAYKPEGSAPLGISTLNETIFMDNNNKMTAFCSMFAPGTSFDVVNGGIIQGNTLYQKVTVEEQILRTRTSLAAIFTLSSPLQELTEGIFGQFEVVAALKNLNKKAFENGLPMFADWEHINPNRRTPLKVAIPLKSNVEKYGPYYVNGTPGKTEFIEDSNLAPWNFGGYEAMGVYAQAQIDLARGTNQFMESGQLSVAGVPEMNLGQLLDGNGPSVTDISMTIGASGIKTLYTFRTFSPRNGEMSKQFADRLRGVSLTTQRLRRDLKDSIKESLAIKQIKADSKKTIKFEETLKKEFKRNTPHDVIVCNLYNKDLVNDNFTATRKCYSQVTNLKEALTMLSAKNNDRYKFNAVMSLNGIFAPFSMKSDYGNVAIPKTSLISKFSSNIVTWETYNHFANKSIDVLSYGETYKGVKPKADTPVADLKPVAFRGPIWINGYGQSFSNLQGFTSDKATENSKSWMVGPLDAMFDNYRGVWTYHTTIIGMVRSKITKSTNFKTNPSISNMGIGNVAILGDCPETSNIIKNSSNVEVVLPCRNTFAKDIDVGVIVVLQFNPHYNCFIVTGADCT